MLRIPTLLIAGVVSLPSIAEASIEVKLWLNDLSPLRRACRQGEVWACDELGRVSRPLASETGAWRRAGLKMLKRACRGGSTETCLWMAEASSQDGYHPSTRRHMSQYACRAGVDAGCAIAGPYLGHRRKIIGSVLLPLGIALSAGGAVWLHHVAEQPRSLDNVLNDVFSIMGSSVMNIGGHALSAVGHKLYVDGRRLAAGPGSRVGADVISYINMVAATAGAIAPLAIMASGGDDAIGTAAAAAYASTALQGVLAIAGSSMPVGSGHALRIQAAPMALPTRDGAAPAVALNLAF